MAANNIYIQVDYNSQNAQQNVNALNNALANTGKSAEKGAKEATGALNSIHLSIKQTASSFGDLATALGGLGIANLIGGLIKLSAELGRDRIMMETFAGSADAARQIFDDIQGIARRGVFHTKELEDTARTMLAFGMAAKDVPATLETITDQVTAMGGSIEQVNSIVRVFGRVMSKEFIAANDLMRLLPQQGVKVMDALQKALSEKGIQATREQVMGFIKEGALKPLETLNVILHAMQEGSRGTGEKINDAAKAFKNLTDIGVDAAEALGSDKGFGLALKNLAREITQILAPLAALLQWLMDLPEPTKEMIVNVVSATAAVVAFAGAWEIFTKISGPAIDAIWGIGKALAKAIVFVITNPEVLLAMATLTAFIGAFAVAFPEKFKQVEETATKWITDLWDKLKQKAAALAKKSGLFDALTPRAELPPVTDIKQEVKFDELQKKVNEWSNEASKSILQALSSPVEAVAVKYKTLFDELEDKIEKQNISEEHAAQLRAQLRVAQATEEAGKEFDKFRQSNAEKAKLDAQRVKGSYDAQIAYIEALDQQDLRHKVAAIDRVTELRAASAQAVAQVEKDELEANFKEQARLFEANRKEFETFGLDVDKAIRDRHQEMVDKQMVIDQKAVDDAQKYRLEGWKKANDAIIEDQKRVYDAFKSEFDQLFDALLDKSKSIGQALGDVFKQLALGEVRNIFSAQMAAMATQAAGYGRPTEQITRGGGILSMIFQRGMSPRPPGPPPEIYQPGRGEGGIRDTAATQTAQAAQTFETSADAYDAATIRFALAVERFAGGGGGGVRTVGFERPLGGNGGPPWTRLVSSTTEDAFAQASAASGVNPALLRAVAQAESGMRAGAISPKGAQGLMQLMPSVQQDWGVTNPFDVKQNVGAGASQLGYLLNRYGGDIPSALAAYNMGAAAFDRATARGRPLPAETQAYVARVMGLMGQQPQPLTGPIIIRSREDVMREVNNFGQPSIATPSELAEFGMTATGTAAPTRPFQPPPGWAYDTSGNLYYRPVGDTAPWLPEPPVPGSLSAMAPPEVIAQAQQLSALGRVGGLAMGGVQAVSQQDRGAARLFNVSTLKDLFGIGGATGAGGTSLRSVLMSKGVANLAAMGGMMAITAGMRKRFAPLTVAGGALAGVKLGQMMGMGWAQGPLMGAGIGLFMAGVQRGGGAGLGMAVGGGALAGAMIGLRYGGPIGGLIGLGVGAAVGLATGVVRLFYKTEAERIQREIKQVYGVDITDRQVIASIKEIVDSKYGGNVAVGVRSQDVQDIIRLYALSTGQVAGLPRQMYSATIEQSTRGVQLQQVYEGGRAVQNPYTGPTSYQYQSAVANAQGLMGVPGASGIISNQFQQLTLDTIRGNPAAIAQASAAAASAGDSRLTTTQAMQEPLTALA